MSVYSLLIDLPPDQEVIVVHPRVEVSQPHHQLEVCGEEDEAAAAQQLLAHGPADGAARLHGRAPPQLVQDDEGGGTPVGQQEGRLLHLQHELTQNQHKLGVKRVLSFQ